MSGYTTQINSTSIRDNETVGFIEIPKEAIRHSDGTEGEFMRNPSLYTDPSLQAQAPIGQSVQQPASHRPGAYSAVQPNMTRNEARAAVAEAKAQYRAEQSTPTQQYNTTLYTPSSNTQPKYTTYINTTTGYIYNVNGIDTYTVDNIVEKAGKVISFDIVDSNFNPTTSYMNILISKIWHQRVDNTQDRLDGTYLNIEIKTHTGVTILKFTALNDDFEFSTAYNFPKVTYKFVRKAKEIL